jgi:hypothetical protein
VNQGATRISTRSKDIFASAYLTLASIIQGVALAALVQRVESSYGTLDATAWIMVITVFVAVIVIWHEYLMMVLAYVWVPGILDSIIPFAFVAGELFMAHFATSDQRSWLLAYGITFAVGLAASLLTQVQVTAHFEENRQILALTGRLGAARGALAGGLAVLALIAWAVYVRIGLDQVKLGVALVALSLVIIFAAVSLPFWNQVVRHARGGESPTT